MTIRLISLALVGLACTCVADAFAQADRPEVPRHKDPVFQGVQDHVNRLCEAHDERLQTLQDETSLLKELEAARAKFLKLLDLNLDQPRQPPKSRLVGKIDCEDYVIEKVIVESAPGVPVPCNVYVPKSGPRRKATLIIPHGHGGRDWPSGQNAYQRFAKSGFIVLAKDGWGKQERRSTGHETRGGHLFLTGASLMALELFDNVRCIDYLLSRSDVDPERLGMTGASGGGSQTLFCAAVEKRLAAASPTCAVTSLRSDLADTDMCICELLTDILTVGDHSTFLAMAYPRPMLVVNGIQDYMFPINGARASVRDARWLYAQGKHQDRMRLAEFDAPHSWNDEMIAEQIRFFRKSFDLPPLKQLPAGDAFRSREPLQCYPNGDVPTDSRTIADVHRAGMERFLRRQGNDKGKSAQKSKRDYVIKLIRSRWSGKVTLPEKVARKTLGPDRSLLASRERLTWQSGLGGEVTALVSVPLDKTLAAKARKNLVLRLHGDRETDRLERYYWNDRIRTHATVVELSYTGKTLNTHQTGQIATALLASGRSLMAERVRDILVALAFVGGSNLVAKNHELTVVGHHYDGPLLLVAAPLLPKHAHLVLDRTQITYRHGSEVDLGTDELGAETAHWNVLPYLARRLDLADLLDLAYPRNITLYHPLNSARHPLSSDAWKQLSGGLDPEKRRHIHMIGADSPRIVLLRHLNHLVTGGHQK
jgi:dienelactone hydrolase